MNDIYKKIWELAKPYYKKGRPMDIDHIEWMMKEADKMCDIEGIDKTIFLPLVILHDVGYSEVQDPKSNPFQLDMRRAHMKAGEELSQKILKKLGYDPEKIKKISYYISVHDGWALGNNDLFINDPILGTFNDLDFMWMATSKGFPSILKIRKYSSKEMLDYLINSDKLIKRPFSNKTNRELFEKYISERKKEI